MKARLGHPVVAGVGMAVAAGGYVLITAWPLAAPAGEVTRQR